MDSGQLLKGGRLLGVRLNSRFIEQETVSSLISVFLTGTDSFRN